MKQSSAGPFVKVTESVSVPYEVGDRLGHGSFLLPFSMVPPFSQSYLMLSPLSQCVGDMVVEACRSVLSVNRSSSSRQHPRRLLA